MMTVDRLAQEREWRFTANDAGDHSELGSDFAEAHEHPFVQLPFSVSIDSRTYEGVEISMVGARVAGLVAKGMAGLNKLCIFRFNFDGFAIGLPIEVRVTSQNTETGQLYLQFREPTGQHMPHLRYIINSWLAGEYVHLDGVIEARRRTGVSSHASEARIRRKSRFRQFLGALLLGFATLALVCVAANAISERFFISDVTGVSIVDRITTPLRATIGGQLAFIDPNAAKGKPAYSILASNGTSVTVAMPCDCATEKSVENGATVSPGEPLMLLSNKDAGVLVRSSFDASDLRLVATGAAPEIELPNGETVTARVEIDRLALAAGPPDGAINVQLLPTKPLSDDLVGRPVYVRLDSTPAWIVRLIDRLESGRLFLQQRLGQ